MLNEGLHFFLRVLGFFLFISSSGDVSCNAFLLRLRKPRTHCRLSNRETQMFSRQTDPLRTASWKVQTQKSTAWLCSFVLTYFLGLWLSGLQQGEGVTLLNYHTRLFSGLISAHRRVQSQETWTLPDHARVISHGLQSYMLTDFALKRLRKACMLVGLSWGRGVTSA